MWTASTATVLAGTAVGMASGPGQLVMLGGGLAVAAPYLWHARRRPPLAAADDELPVLTAPGPRIEAFRARFFHEVPCKGAELHSVRDIPDGFAFEITLAVGKATTHDVMGLGSQIAALYDVPADQVSIEYTANRSERRARISVLTVENAFAREDRWDGRPTYDPETGMIRVGRFVDSTPMHWMLHKPGSGSAGGIIAGATGGGKTGTMNVIASEAGQAKLCTVCGAAGTCARCDMRRIAVLWMGDPQVQGLAVWKGDGSGSFADLLAWGPLACVQLIIMAHTAMRERAAYFGSMPWTDHRGRTHIGKGSFDPTPEYPLIFLIIDEWPLIAHFPGLKEIVVPLVSSIVKEGRKVGISLILLTQVPDVQELGDDRALREMLKAFNVIAHRADPLSGKGMLGIQGDPTKLPPGLHGIGYNSGPDNRPATTFRTKHCPSPEHLKPGDPGPDVRDFAEQFARDPVHLDDAVLNAITPLGYTGRHQELGDDLIREAMAAAAAALPAKLSIADALRNIVAGMPVQPVAQKPPGTVQEPPGSSLADVLAERGELDLFDVSDALGVDALEADRLLGELAAAGLAVQTGPGRYRATITTGRT
jgi:hypothetical protein